MATCRLCNGEMTKVERCLPTQLRYTPYLKRRLPEHIYDVKGQRNYLRVRFGAEKRFSRLPSGVKEPQRCPDCNVVTGACHHPGCDWEECPRCGRQLISCDCNDAGKFVDYKGKDLQQ